MRVEDSKLSRDSQLSQLEHIFPPPHLGKGLQGHRTILALNYCIMGLLEVVKGPLPIMQPRNLSYSVLCNRVDYPAGGNTP